MATKKKTKPAPVALSELPKIYAFADRGDTPSEAVIAEHRELPVLHEQRRTFAELWADKFMLLVPTGFYTEAAAS